MADRTPPHDIDHIRDLVPDSLNRRAHTPRNIGMIAESLQGEGAGRSILIDEEGTLIAGHGVVEAAAQVGITKVKVVDTDGSTLVAVRRKGLTAEQKRRLAISDNRSNELSEWDIERLAADRDEGLDLSPFFTDDELDTLLGKEDDRNAPVNPINVPRAYEVVWVTVAVPMEKWPTHQEAIERLKRDADCAVMVSRPRDSMDANLPAARGDKDGAPADVKSPMAGGN
jgi:hypothetical protein